ncbi:response regulator transcription factor [Achromobacter sp. NPDC008082]|jgi:FixJ family two-component response regulator|uniref:response regulator transcription factor n=1 Tax=Achromobacter sp. NPDC008082 TaxID=3363888 RepID=UPI0036E9646E
MNHASTIAIVDDDDGVRVSLSSLVRSLGYAVRTYGSAHEFLHDPDVGTPVCLIADIQMPLMTGDQLQAALLAAGRRLPMIFMTAFPTEAMRRRVMDAGACAYLEKPVDADAIARCLAAAMARRAALD